ncbi:METTL5 family protein [Methanobrevibacter curvatus]|uniref:Ribosomal protein L11 methyltransferase n=1 Tax=Methanobrevibacter curvatus TaxID=49547 RepID=A0A165ZUX6_9EURY|nr:METTL5 family protein [Methanobrevibacter curvatus]KZX11194.1 ribosomal protein L11 methyltransferase [Methanobrevibacter curvatus]
MIIKKKKNLEIFLEKVPSHPNPKVELEQYSTSSLIASDLMWNAFNIGDIHNKRILDLGCGTGIFSIASNLLDSKYSLGIDIDDESIKSAIVTSKQLNLKNIKFISEDIKHILEIIDSEFVFKKKFPCLLNINTVIQNPPFGSQKKSKKSADRDFIEFAMKISPVVYSFHMKSTEKFVIEYFSEFGGELTHKFSYNFPIANIYNFHSKESKDVKVTAFRFEKINK